MWRELHTPPNPKNEQALSLAIASAESTAAVAAALSQGASAMRGILAPLREGEADALGTSLRDAVAEARRTLVPFLRAWRTPFEAALALPLDLPLQAASPGGEIPHPHPRLAALSAPPFFFGF